MCLPQARPAPPDRSIDAVDESIVAQALELVAGFDSVPREDECEIVITQIRQNHRQRPVIPMLILDPPVIPIDLGGISS